MTILVVDWDTKRLINTELLVRNIYPQDEILAYTDPLLAAQYSCNHMVEVVVAAWEMRRMNGLQMAEFVRKFRPRAQIYLTACPQERAGGVTRTGEADALLGEPLTEKALRDAIAFVKKRCGKAG